MLLKGFEVNTAEFFNYYRTQFPEIYDRFSQNDKMNLFKNKIDLISDLLDDSCREIINNLKPNNYEFNYVVSHENCDMTNELQTNVNRHSTYNGDLKKQIDQIWGCYFHFKIKNRRDLNNYHFSLYNPIDNVAISYLENEDMKEYQEYSTKKEIQEASNKLTNAIAALIAYTTDFSAFHSVGQIQINEFESIKNDILSNFDNFDNMFLFNEGSWISEKEMDYIKKYNLEINIETYIKEYKIMRKSTILFNKDTGKFIHQYKDSLNGSGYQYMRDDRIFESAEDINTVFEHADKHSIRSIDVNIQ